MGSARKGNADIAAIEALELYREFHSKATNPFTRAFCAAFNAADDTRSTTAAEREQLISAVSYAKAYVTQTFFDFLNLVENTAARSSA